MCQLREDVSVGDWATGINQMSGGIPRIVFANLARVVSISSVSCLRLRDISPGPAEKDAV